MSVASCLVAAFMDKHGNSDSVNEYFQKHSTN